MAGKYPDVIFCNPGNVLYVHSVSDQSVVYRDFTNGALYQIEFTDDGNSSTASSGVYLNNCWGKTISQLIDDNKAFNLNTPVITCPSDITSDNPVVEFKIASPPGFSVTSTPPTKSAFPFGVTTAVSAKASHSNGLNLSCTFKVTIRPDTMAP